jgi:flagellar basal body-associated protein FliL
MNGADIIAIIILVAIVIAICVYLTHWLYRHSSKDLSFAHASANALKQQSMHTNAVQSIRVQPVSPGKHDSSNVLKE